MDTAIIPINRDQAGHMDIAIIPIIREQAVGPRSGRGRPIEKGRVEQLMHATCRQAVLAEYETKFDSRNKVAA